MRRDGQGDADGESSAAAKVPSSCCAQSLTWQTDDEMDVTAEQGRRELSVMLADAAAKAAKG